MIYFNNDYSEGCHPKILEVLTRTNLEQTFGYGEDEYCTQAAEKIRALCGREDAAVHFLVGGTQTNLTVIAAALRPHQGVLCADSGHINVHETGAVEATGHKVLGIPSQDGKITAGQVREAVLAHRKDASFEHTVQPKMVYISNPTELGTLYTKAELEALGETCRELGLYLFLDGARLGYGLAAKDNDLTLKDIADCCDVFYIGGTKCGTLFGEAVVIPQHGYIPHFFTYIKQQGALLAKGRLLGIQFDVLFTDGLYETIGQSAIQAAQRIRETLIQEGYSLYIEAPTNQIFPILKNEDMEALSQQVEFSFWEPYDAYHTVVRLATDWATTDEDVEKLLSILKTL